jgi:predicted glycosyltransferase
MSKQTILFDVKHPAQLNLFRGLAYRLKNEGWDVLVCYLDRGKLPAIIKREYLGIDLLPIGSSRGTKWSIFWNGNVKRTTEFIKLIKRHRFSICVAASSAPLALACRLTGTPIIQFYDDPERKRINQINGLLSDMIFFPPLVPADRRTGIFNCLKEWSYLSPSYFNPRVDVLQKYKIDPYSYIFVREVSNKSFNYMDQEDAVVCRFSAGIDHNTAVLLSLEDKTIRNKFPAHWTILEEPIEDIHSLIYFSRLMLSSGDSMAREGAMLGVPSIYCGIRDMKANLLLEKRGLLQHIPGAAAKDAVNRSVKEEFDIKRQEAVRRALKDEWDDMQEFMYKKINYYKKNRL